LVPCVLCLAIVATLARLLQLFVEMTVHGQFFLAAMVLIHSRDICQVLFFYYSGIMCDPTQVENSNFSPLFSISGSTGQSVSVTCLPGFTGGGTTTCRQDGNFTTVLCSAIVCEPTQVPHSNMAEPNSISGGYGTSITVVCDPGYSGDASTSCLYTGFFSPVACVANACASTQVDNSDYATYNSLSGFVGATFTVTCNQGYEGSGVAICLPDGAFDVPSCTLIPNFVQAPSLLLAQLSDSGTILS